MAKLTLLQMVQNIMNAIDSDAVASIDDTVESGQIADILFDTFEQMRVNQMIPEFMELGQLMTVDLMTSAGALNYLEIPDTISELEYIQYDREKAGDNRLQYETIEYITPEEFLVLVSQNDSTSADCVQVTDPTNDDISYYVVNNVGPTYWTSFDDKYIAFNQLDMGIDTDQLLGSKTICRYQVIPTWTRADSFIPPVDDNLFPFLLAEAKSTAYFNLKQQPNNKIDKQAKEQKYKFQNHKFRTTQRGIPGPNYGRPTSLGGPYYGPFAHEDH